MAATGMSSERLTDAIMNRLKSDVGATETDFEGKATPLRKVASLIAEEIIKELTNAIVTVYVPAGQVVVNVTGGATAPAVGVVNPSPIQADNSASGGLS